MKNKRLIYRQGVFPCNFQQLLIQREKLYLVQMVSVSGRMRELTSLAPAMCFSS